MRKWVRRWFGPASGSPEEELSSGEKQACCSSLRKAVLIFQFLACRRSVLCCAEMMLTEQADFFGATETPHAARTAGFEHDLVKYIIRSCNMLQEVAQNSSWRDRLLLASPPGAATKEEGPSVVAGPRDLLQHSLGISDCLR